MIGVNRLAHLYLVSKTNDKTWDKRLIWHLDHHKARRRAGCIRFVVRFTVTPTQGFDSCEPLFQPWPLGSFRSTFPNARLAILSILAGYSRRPLCSPSTRAVFEQTFDQLLQYLRAG